MSKENDKILYACDGHSDECQKKGGGSLASTGPITVGWKSGVKTKYFSLFNGNFWASEEFPEDPKDLAIFCRKFFSVKGDPNVLGPDAGLDELHEKKPDCCGQYDKIVITSFPHLFRVYGQESFSGRLYPSK